MLEAAGPFPLVDHSSPGPAEKYRHGVGIVVLYGATDLDERQDHIANAFHIKRHRILYIEFPSPLSAVHGHLIVEFRERVPQVLRDPLLGGGRLEFAAKRRDDEKLGSFHATTMAAHVHTVNSATPPG